MCNSTIGFGSIKSAITKIKVGRGHRTWDVGLGDAETRGTGDVGTLGRGDAGTRGRRDMVREDFGTQRRAGM